MAKRRTRFLGIDWNSKTVQGAVVGSTIVGVLGLGGLWLNSYLQSDPKRPDPNAAQDSGANPVDSTLVGSLGPITIPEAKIRLDAALLRDDQMGRYVDAAVSETLDELKLLAASGDPLKVHALRIFQGAAQDFRARKFDQAERKTYAFLEIAPNLAYGHVFLGLALLGQKDFEAATEAFADGAKLAPEDFDAKFLHGVALLLNHEDDAAIRAFTRCTELTADSGVAYALLGGAYLQEGRNRAAVGVLETARHLAPDFQLGRAWLAAAYWNSNQKDKAVEAARDAIENNPRDVETRTNLCAFILDLRTPEEAIPICETALEFNPKYAFAHYTLGKAYLKQEEYKKAVAEFQRAIEAGDKSARVQDGLARALLRSGKVEEAIGEYRKALLADPDATWAYNFLGLIALRQGDFATSVYEFRRSLSVDSDQAGVHSLLGLALLLRGHTGDAIQSLERATRMNNTEGFYQYQLARAYVRSNRLQLGLDAINTAVALSPKLRTYLRTDAWLEPLWGHTVFIAIARGTDVETDTHVFPDPARGQGRSVDRILDETAARLGSLRDVCCRVRWIIDDRLNLSRIEKEGEFLFLNSEPNPVFLLSFDRINADGIAGKRQWYLFDGRWLFIAVERTAQVTKHELCGPNETLDLFDSHMVPFPIALVHDQKLLLERFHVKSVTPRSVNGRMMDCLILIPKEGTPYSRLYHSLELDIIAGTGLPYRVVTTGANRLERQVFEFTDLSEDTVDFGLTLNDFAKPPEWDAYTTIIERIAEPEEEPADSAKTKR